MATIKTPDSINGLFKGACLTVIHVKLLLLLLLLLLLSSSWRPRLLYSLFMKLLLLFCCYKVYEEYGVCSDCQDTRL
jgi:hypothetical protein